MSLSSDLNRIISAIKDYKVDPKVERLAETAKEVGKSFSGSWLGYHSCIYYKDFVSPPAGARFSSEWGLMRDYLDNSYSVGKWVEYAYDDIINYIYEASENMDLTFIRNEAAKAKKSFEEIKDEVLSLIYAYFNGNINPFLQGYIDEINKCKVYSIQDTIEYLRPKGAFASRDSIAVTKGQITPPHCYILAEALSLDAPYKQQEVLKLLVIKLVKYINNIEKSKMNNLVSGNSIFIGHGRSVAWRDLKDFFIERLKLNVVEFNSEAVAGTTTISRLQEMLDSSCFAFLIMTAEDEQPDGQFNARMNVIHEVGLFQGRLGFDKAIVLLENGCSEFTNISGLSHIKFAPNNIKESFEEIRRVLERHQII